MIIGSYLIYLGLLLFSFSLDKHYRETISKDVNKNIKNMAKILGSMALLSSLIILINIMDVSLGITYWVGVLAVCNLIIAFTYTYKPKTIITLSGILFIASLILTIL